MSLDLNAFRIRSDHEYECIFEQLRGLEGEELVETAIRIRESIIQKMPEGPLRDHVKGFGEVIDAFTAESPNGSVSGPVISCLTTQMTANFAIFLMAMFQEIMARRPQDVAKEAEAAIKH